MDDTADIDDAPNWQSCPAWVRPDDALSVAMCRVWRPATVARFARQLPSFAADAVTSGFIPDRQLGGGQAGIAVAGVWRGRCAVAKFSPSSAALDNQTRVLSHWGPDVTATVYDSGDGWTVMAHVGRPPPGPLPESDWPAFADLVDQIGAAGPLRDLPDGHRILEALITTAAQRPASMEFHGTGGLVDLAARSRDLPISSEVVAHGDLHDGNILTDTTGRLRLIDPEPHLSHPGEDRARWVLGGGTDQITGRARFARDRWEDHEATVAWVRFIARERAGALVHHGKSSAWGWRFITAADAATSTR